MQVRSPFLLCIDNQVSNILQVRREIGEKDFNIAQAQLLCYYIFCMLNCVPIPRFYSMTMHNLVHVMHEISQNIHPSFNLCIWFRY